MGSLSKDQINVDLFYEVKHLKKEHEQLLAALLNAHGVIDNSNPNDHDGALYCKCETALAYQKFAKASGGAK